MDITKILNKCITAHETMKAQAGARMIVSFRVNRGDYSTNETTHYGSIQEVLTAWDKLITRYGEENVSMSSEHSEAICKYIKG